MSQNFSAASCTSLCTIWRGVTTKIAVQFKKDTVHSACLAFKEVVQALMLCGLAEETLWLRVDVNWATDGEP